MIQIQIDPTDLANVQRMLREFPEIVPLVISRAVNRTLAGVKTDASTEIRAVITATKTVTDKTFTVQNTTRNNLKGKFESTGTPLPMGAFTKRVGKTGVSVQIRKDRGYKLIPSAFVKKYSRGEQDIFVRKYHAAKKAVDPRIRYARLPYMYRFPIKKLYSSRVPDVLSNDPVMEKVLEKAGDRLHKRLEAELNFEMSKL